MSAAAEEAALAAMCEAWDSNDRDAAREHWRRFVQLHYERPKEVVRRMEEERNLT